MKQIEYEKSRETMVLRLFLYVSAIHYYDEAAFDM